MKNAFNIVIKYSSVYSAHTKIHIIKNNNIELDFPSTRFTMIFMSEFVRRYNFIGLYSDIHILVGPFYGWSNIKPTLNQYSYIRSFPLNSYLCTRHTPNMADKLMGLFEGGSPTDIVGYLYN